MEVLECRATPATMIDAEFGAGGLAVADLGLGADDAAADVAVGADGQFFVAGESAGRLAVLKFDPDGSADASFGDGGRFVLGGGRLGEPASAQTVALDADGRAVVAGRAGGDIVVLRVTADGSLDASFGDGGLAVIDTDGPDGSPAEDSPDDIAVLADGRVAVAGSRTVIVGGDVLLPPEIVIARLDADGKPDVSLGGDGLVTFPARDGVTAAALAPSGGFFIAGSESSDLTVEGYTAAGSLDAAFGDGGRVVIDVADGSADFARGIAVDPGGRVVVIGEADPDLAVVRLNADGSPDATFSGDGRAAYPNFLPGSLPTVGPAFAADGSMLFGTFLPLPALPADGGPPGGEVTALARVNADGSRDADFGEPTIDLGPNENAAALAVGPGGEIFVGGSTRRPGGVPRDAAVARLTPAGAADPSFGTGGVLRPEILTLSDETTRAIVGLPGGGAYAIGEAEADGGEVLAVARFDAAGSLDAAFGDGGTVSLPGVPFARLGGAALRPDGTLLLASDGVADFALAVLRPDGTLDPAFGTGGVLRIDLPLNAAGVTDVALAGGGLIVLGVTDAGGPAAVRLTADGQVVGAFGGDGVAEVGGDAAVPSIGFRVLADDAAGRVLVVGTTADSLFAVSLNPITGEPDATYGDGGRAVIPRDGEQQRLTVAELRPDGKLILGGQRDFRAIGLYRLDADGEPDAAFGDGGLVELDLPGPIDDVDAVAFRDGGTVVVGRTGEPFAAGLVVAGALDGTDVAVLVLNDDGSVDGESAFADSVRGEPIGDPVGVTVGPAGRALIGVRAGTFAESDLAVLAVSAFDQIPPDQNTQRTFVVSRFNSPRKFTVGPGGTVGEVTGFGGLAVTAEVTGDGVPDVVSGGPPAGRGSVFVTDGASDQLSRTFNVFEESFTGGVLVAAADLNGDGVADIAAVPQFFGAGRVAVFDGATGDTLADFFGIDDANFRGGARAAFGDIDGDGTPDLIVAAGVGGGPRVAVYDGESVAAGAPVKLVDDFFVFEDSLRDGAFITAGDLDGDGADDVIAGGGPNGGPRVFALSGSALIDGSQEQLANFFAGDPLDRGGARVTAKDRNGDGVAEIVVTSRPAAPAVRIYDGATVPVNGTPPSEEITVDIPSNVEGDYFVG